MDQQPTSPAPAWRGADVARAIGAAAALCLLVAVIFLLNSPIADREAERSSLNPATATLHCGRPLLHDVEGLRERHWSAPPAGREDDTVLDEDVVRCRDLVGEHRARARVSGGLGVGLAVLAGLVAVGSLDLSRRRRA